MKAESPAERGWPPWRAHAVDCCLTVERSIGRVLAVLRVCPRSAFAARPWSGTRPGPVRLVDISLAQLPALTPVLDFDRINLARRNSSPCRTGPACSGLAKLNQSSSGCD